MFYTISFFSLTRIEECYYIMNLISVITIFHNKYSKIGYTICFFFLNYSKLYRLIIGLITRLKMLKWRRKNTLPSDLRSGSYCTVRRVLFHLLSIPSNGKVRLLQCVITKSKNYRRTDASATRNKHTVKPMS